MQVEQAGPPNRPERCLQENNRASQGRSRTRKRNRPSLPLEGSFLPRPTGKKPSRAFGRAPICRVTSGFPIEALTRSASTPTGASGAPRPAPRSPRGKPKAAAIGRGGVFRGDGEGKGPPAGNRRSAKSDFPAIRKSRTPGGGWQRPCHRSLFEILRRGRIFGRYQFLFEVPRASSSCSLLPPRSWKGTHKIHRSGILYASALPEGRLRLLRPRLPAAGDDESPGPPFQKFVAMDATAAPKTAGRAGRFLEAPLHHQTAGRNHPHQRPVRKTRAFRSPPCRK